MNIFESMIVCLCIRMYVCTSVCECTNVWGFLYVCVGQMITSDVVSQDIVCYGILEQGFSLASMPRLSWLTFDLLGSAYLCLLSAEIISMGHHA